MDRLDWLFGWDEVSGIGVLVALYVALAATTTVHILLHKESSRAAAGWTGLAWLSPVFGAVLYTLFGVNRLRRKAAKLRRDDTWVGPESPDEASEKGPLPELQRAVGQTTGRPLIAGNCIVPLQGGEQALPAMLEAISEATQSVALMTFLFDLDAWGARFVEALTEARARGVEVRVLVDGVGTWFSWPWSGVPSLRRAGVDVRRFLWSPNPLRMTLLNLRNHRKVLVVDGTVGFTGGMNIRGSFVDDREGPRTAHDDLHVKVEGPVVRDLMALFAVDWAFESDERLDGPRWFPELPRCGAARARVVPDGPDEDLDKAEMVLIDAVAAARHSVRVQTPYFLPEEGLRAALTSAARRGVSVDIVVPWPSNHWLVDRAMRAELRHLLAQGVRVWGQPAPFDHTKLLVVDGVWSCVGSANWDPRSLRLNFEMLLEIYGEETAKPFVDLFERKRSRSVAFELSALDARRLVTRVAEGAARLLKPYL